MGKDHPCPGWKLRGHAGTRPGSRTWLERDAGRAAIHGEMRGALLALGLAVASLTHAHADTSKLGKDAVAPGPRAWPRGKSKLCCGYPLSATRGFKYTFYWMADEKRHDDTSRWPRLPDDVLDRQGVGMVNRHIALYTRDGVLIGSFVESFVEELKMEGSGWLADGRVINYAGRCRHGMGTCFEILDSARYPYGRGAGARPLVPFRSVAVDRRLIPIGETLYVPEFDGLPLPDGTFHDGCLRADDTGGAIRRRLIDFFVVELENFLWVNHHMWLDRWFTPHVEDPRCDYLRDEP